jgi:hypothetical protein
MSIRQDHGHDTQGRDPGVGPLRDLTARRRESPSDATAKRQLTPMYQQRYWQTPAPPANPGYLAQHWSPELQGRKVPVIHAHPTPVQPEGDPLTLPEPPPALAIAVPPLADAEISVVLETDPPATRTPPRVLPTPIVLPTLPPLLMLPMETVPPWALALATPPLPALAAPLLQMPPRQEATPQQAASDPQRLPS